MEERAVKRGFGWFIVLVLPLVLILGVVPCAAEGTHNLQALIDKTDNGGVVTIDNLELSNFAVELKNAAGNATPPNPENISVVTFGEGTLNPGLRFDLSGELSVPTSSTPGARAITISYTAKHRGGDFIEGKSLLLDPLTAISGSGAAVAVREDFRNEQSVVIGGVVHELKDNTLTESSNITLDTPRAVLFPVISVSVKAPASGQALIESFEQKFNLLPAPGGPIADAGPDLAVFDQVSLDGSSSPADATCQWELYQKVGDDWVPLPSVPPGAQAEFRNLENGFYEARLTVTDSQGVSAFDSAIIAAAGAPSGGGTEPGTEENAELNLWDFTLKKYRYCKWSTARMVGTFDLPDDLEFAPREDLVGKVTIQLNRGEEPLVVMSDDIKLKVSNWKYKLEISKH